MDYKDACDTIEYLNLIQYGEYNDWRLPTVKEASSLFEKDKNDDKFLNNVFIGPIAIWTSDSPANNPDAIMIIDYRYKSARTQAKSDRACAAGVIAIRDN